VNDAPKEWNMSNITENRKVRHDYYIEETIQAGLKLEGWEVKSLRDGKGQLADSYVIFKDGEAFLFGALIQPLVSASTHTQNDPLRTRKLLLQGKQISKLQVAVEQKGYTCVALNLHWSKHLVKCTIALAKGKKNHDKRDTIKDREVEREIQRIDKNKKYR
jgi:SsrA-binding protein